MPRDGIAQGRADVLGLHASLRRSQLLHRPTDNLEVRIAQHHAGALTCYTLTRRPLVLAFSQEFVTREEALAVERQLKGWSRAKKEALIRADWAAINRLSRGKHRHQRSAG